jgi:hypothetical protein
MMMLPGYALVAQGTQIHVAAWPFGEEMLLLSRALARQGACYVISVGAAWTKETVPEYLIELGRPPEDIVHDGPGSRIIDPQGNILVEVPTTDEEAIITAEGSLEAVMEHKLVCDIAGHYSRPDVLQLHINRRPLERLVESDSIDRSVATADVDAARYDSADEQR